MRYQRLAQQCSWSHRLLAVFVPLLGVLLLGLASQPVAADWLGNFRGTAAKRPALDLAAAQLKTFAATAKGPALAATVSQEGHWTFVNARGERFTAASPDELKRVVSALAPENRAPDNTAPTVGAGPQAPETAGNATTAGPCRSTAEHNEPPLAIH